jgi:hypothetical protein
MLPGFARRVQISAEVDVIEVHWSREGFPRP